MDMFQLNILNDYHRVHGLPAFVKESAVVTVEEAETLPTTAFADPRRKLPIHTKSATWCSFLAFRSNAVKDPTGAAAANLEKAAAFWGIGEECRAIAANLQKQAQALQPTDRDFALVREHEGMKVRLCPIVSPSNVKESATYLLDNADRYPLEWRKEAADVLLKRANELAVHLVQEHQLQQMAGVGMAKASEITPHLRLRANLVKNAALRSTFLKLAKAIEDAGDMQPDELAKMASAIDLADRASGIYQYYGRGGVVRPEEFCHQHTLSELQVKSAGLIRLTNGQAVNKEALAAMPADAFTLLGDDFVSAIRSADGKVDVTKAAEIIPTLPADDANKLVNSL